MGDKPIRNMALTFDQYDEVCRRVGRAVIGMLHVGYCWFNCFGDNDTYGAGRMINNRVTKWIEHIVRSEWRSVAEERSDNIDKMHFPKDGVEKIEIN